MSKVEEKIEKVAEDVTDIKVVLSRLEVLHERNTVSLEEHIKRTNALEDMVIQNEQNFSAELKPIQTHISFVKGAMWVIGVLFALVLGLKQLGLF
jgi:septation ring formation regulator EzrA